MDTIYEHPTKGQNADYGSPVTVYGSWDSGIQAMWTQALIGSGYRPMQPVWNPTYDGPFYVYSENGQSAALNPYETPTQDTALELMKKYGASRCIPRKFEGAGGPNISDAVVRWLEWPAVNSTPLFGLKAGMLAAIHTRNANNPDVARNLCLAAIDTARKGGQQVPSD